VFSLCFVTFLVVELEVKPGVQNWSLYRIHFLRQILLLTHFYGRRVKGEGGSGWMSEELTQGCKVVTSSAARSSNPGRDSMIWMQGNTSHVLPSRTHSSPGQTWSMLSFNTKCWLYTRLTTETRKPSEFIFPMHYDCVYVSVDVSSLHGILLFIASWCLYRLFHCVDNVGHGQHLCSSVQEVEATTELFKNLK
jgi:hypothetical protein